MDNMSREEQLLLKIKILEEIIDDTDRIAQMQKLLQDKKDFAARLKDFGKIPKTDRIKQARKEF